MVSLRFLWYIPLSIFFVLNMTFLLIIWIMRNVGKGMVWLNNNISEAGDFFTDKTKNDKSLDNFLEKVQKEKVLHGVEFQKRGTRHQKRVAARNKK